MVTRYIYKIIVLRVENPDLTRIPTASLSSKIIESCPNIRLTITTVVNSGILKNKITLLLLTLKLVQSTLYI